MTMALVSVSGSLPNVTTGPAAFALADVVVLPATDPQPVGRSIVEAQAMGKPVVVTNVGGLEETVLPASTGWLVPHDDVGELAWATDLALGLDDEVRDRIAERGRNFVTHEFGKEADGTANRCDLSGIGPPCTETTHHRDTTASGDPFHQLTNQHVLTEGFLHSTFAPQHSPRCEMRQSLFFQQPRE